MDEVSRAYIAGFFDGEGDVTFAWPRAGKNGKKYGRLMARISQCDRRVLDWIQEVTGFGSIHVKQRSAKTNGRWRNVHVYITTYEAARRLLALIRPYLRVKGETVDEKLALDAKHVKRRKAL